jgi:hypothetical protein
MTLPFSNKVSFVTTSNGVRVTTRGEGAFIALIASVGKVDAFPRWNVSSVEGVDHNVTFCSLDAAEYFVLAMMTEQRTRAAQATQAMTAAAADRR